MSTSNRVQITTVRESTPGTTPTTPRMRLARLTGESLSFTPNYINSDEIRSDRMLAAPVKVMQRSEGGINFELSYPDDNSPLSDMLRSSYFNTWVNTPVFDNDGTADSVVTDAGTTANTYVVASGGASVKLGHLVRATGFTNSANNQIFRAASSSGTTIVGTSLGLVAETAPPAAAKLKIVGFQGAAGDITATSTGLASTALDLTTLGLVVGQWLKIGGTAAGDKFATAANNDWVRISGPITATAIPLDNRPSGWSVDAGAAKTLKVWISDQIRNGTTVTSLSIEKGFLDQTTPVYIVNTGMQVNQLSLSMQSGQKITGSFAFMGMSGSESTTTLDASPDAATTGAILAANAHVGRLAQAGVALGSPNWGRQFDFQIANNLRAIEAIDSSSPVGINAGECAVTGRLVNYFGDDSILAKIYAGTLTSLNARVQRNSQALIFSFPSVTLTSGAPVASSKNQDVTLDVSFSATLDPVTGCQCLADRFEYFEA
jgi:hypothetical protein